MTSRNPLLVQLRWKKVECEDADILKTTLIILAGVAPDTSRSALNPWIYKHIRALRVSVDSQEIRFVLQEID